MQNSGTYLTTHDDNEVYDLGVSEYAELFGCTIDDFS